MDEQKTKMLLSYLKVLIDVNSSLKESTLIQKRIFNTCNEIEKELIKESD